MLRNPGRCKELSTARWLTRPRSVGCIIDTSGPRRDAEVQVKGRATGPARVLACLVRRSSCRTSAPANSSTTNLAPRRCATLQTGIRQPQVAVDASPTANEHLSRVSRAEALRLTAVQRDIQQFEVGETF